eukprot:g4472.t1
MAMDSRSHVTLATTARFSVFEFGSAARIESVQKPKRARAAVAEPKPPPSFVFPATQRLYMLDTYKLVDEAVFLGVVHDEAQGPAVVLDRTIFHPQGGGQPSDQGTITCGSCAVHVEMVRDVGGVIHHFGAAPGLGSWPEAGRPASLVLDGPRRLRHAALHSAGHAVDKAVVGAVGAGVFLPLKGYHFDDSPYVEYRGVLPEGLTKDAFIEKLNSELDKIVTADMATVVETGQALSPLEGEAIGETPNKAPSGAAVGGAGRSPAGKNYGAETRVVTVAGLSCPCGGTHVRSTRELEGVSVTKVKAKKGTLRVSYSLVSPQT